MQQFAEAYGLNQALCEDGSLTAEEPATLASFIAFARGPRRTRVYLRGQDCWGGSVTPSLFREAPTAQERKSRWDAYQAFLGALPSVVPGTRVKRQNFGAVLQHYGFRTPWLDVVDDIHAAVWFALHNRHERSGLVCYQRSGAPSGCVLVLAAPKGVHVQDLRSDHSSRNTRCHVQQGFSLAMQSDEAGESCADQDFASYLLGVVRIPTSEQWKLEGFRASQSYFFPTTEIDSTYRRLLVPKVAELAAKTASEFGVPGVLGQTAKYSDLREESAS